METKQGGDNLPEWISDSPEGALVLLHAQPGAKRDGVAGTFNGRLKIAMTAPPVDGKANAHLAKWLSKTLRVPKSSVVLVSGETSRDKRVRILGASAKAVAGALGV